MFQCKIIYVTVITAMFFASIAGCRSSGMPSDPLLVSHKPLKADFKDVAPQVAVHTEPALPAFPTVYLAARGRQIEHHANALEAGWPAHPAPSRTPGVLTSHPRSKNDDAKSHRPGHPDATP